MLGIDISSNNGRDIDFKRVKNSGVEIVYIKATEGVSYVNPYLMRHYNGAKEQGFKIGFYHYLQHNTVAIEVEHFLSTIEGLEADCKYAIDVESEWSKSEASKATREFADILISKGKEVAIYTGDYFYRDKLDDTVKDLPLWVANYGGAIMAQNYVGLQYTNKGRIEGINSNVDLDNFNESILLSKSKEEIKVENLVVVGNLVDKRAGEYLADFFKCPVIDGSLPFDYSVVKNVWCVGGQPNLLFTSHANKIIAGANRYDTAQLVLDFIKNGGV